jgi:endogenous inhibitor of DNA gyrase (YacG/DUF329 family)
MQLLCPICKKKVAKDAPEMPFCSERCREVDLGNWAMEKYRVASSEAPQPPDEEEQD